MSCCKAQKICLPQGDDVRVIVECVDGAGLPVDISAAQSIKWSMARNVYSAPIITKTLSSGIVINSPTSFYFDITDTESEQLSGYYYHEAEVINDQGLVYTPLHGQLSISKTLIRPV